jgi:hypothetical protein
MVTQGEVEVHVEGLAKSSEETRDKLRALVRGDVQENTVFGKDVHNEEFGKSGRVDGVVSWDEYTLLAEPVYNNEDCSEAVGVRELFNEVHGDWVPRLFGNRELLNSPVRLVLGGFGAFAGSTQLTIILYKGLEIWPGELLTDKGQCLVNTVMSS